MIKQKLLENMVFESLEDFENAISDKNHLENLKQVLKETDTKSFRPLVYTSLDGDDYKYVDFIRKFVYEKGGIPVNPIETLNYYLSTIAHKGSKKEIIRDCFKLMLSCDEIWVFTKPGNKCTSMELLAEGILAELYVWLSTKSAASVAFYNWADVGVPKYLPQSDWSLTRKEKV